MRRTTLLLLPLLLAGSGGCVAKTAWNVATLPVRVGGKVVDWTTTSQAEADRNRGRRMRRDEAREGRERRAWAKRCQATREAEACASYQGYRAGQKG